MVLLLLSFSTSIFGKKYYLYTTHSNINLVNSLNDQKLIGKIPSKTRVEVLGDKKIEVINHKKIIKDNKEITVKTTTVELWTKIKYTYNLKNKIGWVKTKYLTPNYSNFLHKDWEKIEYKNFPKKENYKNNKKIDVKGIYVSFNSFSSTKKLDSLIKLANETEINTFVIDVKNDFGYLSWKMDKSLLEYNPYALDRYYVKNIEKVMQKLKENNIYTIARIVSFKDPSYGKAHPDKVIRKLKDNTPYTNSDKIVWISPYDEKIWEYNVAVAKEAAKVGFNEIQFDYVRFPASNGGKLDKTVIYPNKKNEGKPVTIQRYLKYAKTELSKLGIYLSADIYGQIGTFKDDMGLGQYWEGMSGYTDYLSPMMYPSHYARYSYGVQIPDADPYKIIYHCTLDSINRNNNIDNPAYIRPWIQDFTARWVKGYIPYGSKEVQLQIDALKDLGINQYLLWNPANRYHPPKIKH
ncbi:putative glycoside hydrolase [Fusobacterium sp. MFO224]|uniref:putative glycoside hydrolase n=1 Tax=Fusobacterium sp. MFO224 TaxID=3378070 RepID=UPI003855E8AC